MLCFSLFVSVDLLEDIFFQMDARVKRCVHDELCIL